MENKLKSVRSELDELGYYHNLAPESVPLVEKLLNDLKTTTGSLQKYMKIAQKAIEDKDCLQAGAEPYICDNARLVKECNELHLAFIQYQDQNEQVQRDLKRRIDALTGDKSDLLAERNKLNRRVKQLEFELVDNAETLLGGGSKSKQLKSSTSSLQKGRTEKFELSSALAMAEKKQANLTKEIKKLKDDNLRLLEENEGFRVQLETREKEIKRLGGMLEGGRPMHAVNKDCCCNVTNDKLNFVQDDVNRLTKEKCSLENRLKDALAKQHEAMKRALHLAERNKMLEDEMKDIDHLALAVEAECNNTVRDNTEKVNRLQERMHTTVLQIQTLERDNLKLKQEKQELNAELDAVLLEKKHLQKVLETSLEDKKKLTDKYNNFAIIEHDLNMEIDRLSQLSASQKRKIAELECNLVSEKVDSASKEMRGDSSSKEMRGQSSRMFPKNSEDKIVQTAPESRSGSPGRTKKSGPPAKSPSKKGNGASSKTSSSKRKSASSKKSSKSPQKGSPERSSSPQGSDYRVPWNTPHPDAVCLKACGGTCRDCCCDNCGSTKQLQELLNNELKNKEQQTAALIETLQTEKNYYMKEYHKVLDQLKTPRSSRPESEKSGKDLLARQLGEKEQSIVSLQHENRVLAREKYELMSRLGSARDQLDSDKDKECFKTGCKRTERERDILRGDIDRLQEERDVLKARYQSQAEAFVRDQDELKAALRDAQTELRRLDSEHHDLMLNQGSKNSAINTLEDHCDQLKEQLRSVQTELNQQKAFNTQLKTLQEETDRAMSDARRQLQQVESELAEARAELKRREAAKGSANREVEMLKADIQTMRMNLCQLDKEKDELLNELDAKTEQLEAMKFEVTTRDRKISSLEALMDDLKNKLSKRIDENASHEHLIRTSQTEMATLSQEFEAMRKLKDSALKENRRLQDDLAAVTGDCRDARTELEICRRQVDDLKSKLQNYVAEVKRTEDLISNKEVERNELLDQFRSLSHEAILLENNNHTLENEAAQAKVQLSVALDHASELERKLENQDSIIRSYEKQIADLTSQMASLEMQVKQAMDQYERTEMELGNMRELCLKLDTENDQIKRQIQDRDDYRTQMTESVERLRGERDNLQHTVAKGRHGVESMERLLKDSRKESDDLRKLNQQLQDEVGRLKSKVEELQDRFTVTSEQLDMYQEKALDYSQQNKQLRREIANDRFHRSSTRDSQYPSLDDCLGGHPEGVAALRRNLEATLNPQPEGSRETEQHYMRNDSDHHITTTLPTLSKSSLKNWFIPSHLEMEGPQSNIQEGSVSGYVRKAQKPYENPNVLQQQEQHNYNQGLKTISQFEIEGPGTNLQSESVSNYFGRPQKPYENANTLHGTSVAQQQEQHRYNNSQTLRTILPRGSQKEGESVDTFRTKNPSSVERAASTHFEVVSPPNSHSGDRSSSRPTSKSDCSAKRDYLKSCFTVDGGGVPIKCLTAHYTVVPSRNSKENEI